LEAKQELVAYRAASEVKDPATGEVLGHQRRMIARLEAISVEDKLTKAKLKGDLEIELKVGDVVEPAVVSNAVAVLPLVNSAGSETDGMKRIVEQLTTGLANRGVPLVERRLIDTAMRELTLQQGAAFDPAKAADVGKQLGAYAVLMGTVAAKGKLAEAHWRLVRVETGEILVAATQLLKDAGPLPPPQHPNRDRSLIQPDTLAGWELTPPASEANWSVRNGVLTNTRSGSSLVTQATFTDFDLHVEFSLPHKCNSGVFLRGRYEVQLIDSDTKPTPHMGSCGAIWGLIAPAKHAYVGPDRWNSLDVRLVDRTVTVRLNGDLLIDSKLLVRSTRGAVDDRESGTGPLMLQSQAVAGARFRNITIRLASQSSTGAKP
jgi:TolB-like protein